MLNRRAFLCGAISAVLAPTSAHAQRTASVPKVGVLLSSNPSPLLDVFRDGLRELRHVEGRTLTIEALGVGGDPDRIPEAVAELLRRGIDVLVIMNNMMALAAKEATATVPLVVVSAHDAVGTGLAASLARPGGNVTGGESLAPELDAKRVEILKAVVPPMTRLAVIYNPADPGMASHLRHTDAAAAHLGVEVLRLEVRQITQLDAALAGIPGHRPDALLPFTDTLVATHIRRVIDVAAKYRVPALYEFDQFARAGGLISYGPSLADMMNRASVYVDAIIKGAHPAALPMQQPTKFELVINLKTARALNLTIPPSLLLRADQVIE